MKIAGARDDADVARVAVEAVDFVQNHRLFRRLNDFERFGKQPGDRPAILAMANSIICVKIASASLALAPPTISLLPSNVRSLNTCYASASPCAGFAVQWASACRGSCTSWWNALQAAPIIYMCDPPPVQPTY